MNTTRIATALLLLVGGFTGCTSRFVADGKSPLLTTEQQPQLKASKPQLLVQTGHANSVDGTLPHWQGLTGTLIGLLMDARSQLALVDLI